MQTTLLTSLVLIFWSIFSTQLVLKTLGVVDLSWWFVFWPIYVPPISFVLGFIIYVSMECWG